MRADLKGQRLSEREAHQRPGHRDRMLQPVEQRQKEAAQQKVPLKGFF